MPKISLDADEITTVLSDYLRAKMGWRDDARLHLHIVVKALTSGENTIHVEVDIPEKGTP